MSLKQTTSSTRQTGKSYLAYESELTRLIPAMNAGSGKPGLPPPGYHHVCKLLKQARGELPAADLAHLAAWVATQSAFQGTVLPHPTIRRVRGIHRVASLPWTSLGRELIWYTGYLSAFSAELALYETQRQALEHAALASDWPRAWNVVCEIEKKHGLSVRLLIWANAILQRNSGIAAQKRLRDEVTAATRNAGMLNFVVAHSSIRNEPSVSRARYADIYNRRMDGLRVHLPSEVADYLAWHLEPNHVPDAEAVANTLWIETSSPIIDMYESALSAIRHLLPLLKDDDLNHGDFGYALLALTKALTMSVGGERERRMLPALEEILRQEESETFDPVADLRSFWLEIETAAGSPDTSTHPQAIPCRVASAAGIESPSVADREELFKLAETFRGLHRFDLIGGWLSLVTSDLGGMAPWRAAWQRFAVLSGDMDSSINEQPNAEIPWLPAAEAQVLLGNLDHDSRTESACWHDNPHIAMRAAGLRIRTALAVGDRYTAIQVAAAAYVHCPSAARERLPIPSTIEGITQRERKEFGRKCAALAIVFDAAGGSGAPNYDTERRQAAEDCLVGYGVQRPSELAPLLREQSDRLLGYFLKHVCVEAVLQKFAVFDSSREAMEDRLSICRALHEAAPSDDVQAEMTSLLRRLMVQKGLRALAKSKVFVDIPSVEKAARRKYGDLFLRYQALGPAAEDSQRAALDEALRAASAAAAGRGDEFRALRLPQNERKDLFTQIVNGIRDEFALSPEHGLDGYLSIRIRHGTLSNHLRAPLTDRGLLATRDARTNAYTNTTSWERYLVGLPQDEAERACRYLREFSEWYDNLIRVIAREWLLVRATADGKAMFEFSIAEQVHAVLAAPVTSTTTFDELMDRVNVYLVFALDDRLTAIRLRLAKEAAVSVQRRMEELDREISQVTPPNQLTSGISSLNHEIRVCRGEVAIAFARLDEWFRRAPDFAGEPFRLGDVLRVCAEVVRPEGGEQLDIYIPPEADGGPQIEGRLFQPYADILTIILQNVMRHSGLPRPAAAVHVKVDDSMMEIKVVSSVAAGLREAGEVRLSRIRDTIASDQLFYYVGREGGSGFLKIAKILRHELALAPHLSFGFADDETFEVVLSIRTRISMGAP
jgi:hypothetical protein